MHWRDSRQTAFVELLQTLKSVISRIVSRAREPGEEVPCRVISGRLDEAVEGYGSCKWSRSAGPLLESEVATPFERSVLVMEAPNPHNQRRASSFAIGLRSVIPARHIVRGAVREMPLVNGWNG